MVFISIDRQSVIIRLSKSCSTFYQDEIEQQNFLIKYLGRKQSKNRRELEAYKLYQFHKADKSGGSGCLESVPEQGQDSTDILLQHRPRFILSLILSLQAIRLNLFGIFLYRDSTLRNDFRGLNHYPPL